MPVLTLTDRIGSQSLGTTSVQTQLSGQRNAAASNYICPAWMNGLITIRGDLSELTPTAGQSVLATLKLQSNDVNFGNYEVPTVALGSVLGATNFQYSRGSNVKEVFPVGLAPPATGTLGGVNIQIFGQTQVNCTVGPRMGATLWISNLTPAESQVYSLMSSKVQGSGPTSTGTTATQVSVGTPLPTISGATGATIFEAFGIVASGTIVASDQTQGFFLVQAPEVPVPIRFDIDPITGFLGATGQVQNLWSYAENLHMEVTTPTSLQEFVNLEVAPANAGNFELGVLYQ